MYEQLKESAWGEILQTTTGFFTALNINTLVKCLKNTTHGQLAANYGNAALVPAGFDVVWKYNPWIRVNDQAGAEISALKCRETYKAGTDEVQITPDVTHKALFQKTPKDDVYDKAPTLQIVLIPNQNNGHCLSIDFDIYAYNSYRMGREVVTPAVYTALSKSVEVLYSQGARSLAPTYLFPTVQRLMSFKNVLTNEEHVRIYDALFMHPYRSDYALWTEICDRLDPIVGVRSYVEFNGVLATLKELQTKIETFCGFGAASVGIHYTQSIDPNDEVIQTSSALSVFSHRTIPDTLVNKHQLPTFHDDAINCLLVGVKEMYPLNATISVRYCALIWLYKAMVTKKHLPVLKALEKCRPILLYVCKMLFGDINEDETYDATLASMDKRIKRAIIFNSECYLAVKSIQAYGQAGNTVVDAVCPYIAGDNNFKEVMTAALEVFKSGSVYPVSWQHGTSFFLKKPNGQATDSNVKLMDLISKDEWSVGYVLQPLCDKPTYTTYPANAKHIFNAKGDQRLKETQCVFGQMTLIERLLTLHYASNASPKKGSKAGANYQEESAVAPLPTQLTSFLNLYSSTKDDPLQRLQLHENVTYLAKLCSEEDAWAPGMCEILLRCIDKMDPTHEYVTMYNGKHEDVGVDSAIKDAVIQIVLTAIKDKSMEPLRSNEVPLGEFKKDYVLACEECLTPLVNAIAVNLKRTIVPMINGKHTNMFNAGESLEGVQNFVSAYSVALLKYFHLYTFFDHDKFVTQIDKYRSCLDDEEGDAQIQTPTLKVWNALVGDDTEIRPQARYATLPDVAFLPVTKLDDVRRNLNRPFVSDLWYSIDALRLTRRSYKSLLNGTDPYNILLSQDGSGFYRYRILGKRDFFLYEKYVPFTHSLPVPKQPRPPGWQRDPESIVSTRPESIWDVLQPDGQFMSNKNADNITPIKEVWKLQDDFSKEEAIIYAAILCPHGTPLHVYASVTTRWLRDVAIPYVEHFYTSHLQNARLREVAAASLCSVDDSNYIFPTDPRTTLKAQYEVTDGSGWILTTLNEACDRITRMENAPEEGRKYTVVFPACTPRLLIYLLYRYVLNKEFASPTKSVRSLYRAIKRSPDDLNVRRRLMSDVSVISENSKNVFHLAKPYPSIKDAYGSRRLASESVDDIVAAVALYVYAAGFFDVNVPLPSLEYQVPVGDGGSLLAYMRGVCQRYCINDVVKIVSDVLLHVKKIFVAEISLKLSSTVHSPPKLYLKSNAEYNNLSLFSKQPTYVDWKLRATESEKLYDFVYACVDYAHGVADADKKAKIKALVTTLLLESNVLSSARMVAVDGDNLDEVSRILLDEDDRDPVSYATLTEVVDAKVPGRKRRIDLIEEASAAEGEDDFAKHRLLQCH